MKTKKLFLCLSLALLAGCASPAAPTPFPAGTDPSAYTAKTKSTGDYFGTLSTLRLYGNFEDSTQAAAMENVWQEIKGLLEEIELAVAVDVPDSDIARFNACSYGESISISSHTAKLLAVVRQVYEDTNGVYDPTVYPLVDLWGFTPRFTANSYAPTYPYDRAWKDGALPLPEETYIDAFCRLVDFSGVILSGSEEAGYTLTKNIPPVTVDGVEYQAQMDLGGIAKGYVVDLVIKLLREEGWEYGYFSSGSSSMGMLRNPRGEEDTFVLAIRKPRQTETAGSAYLTVKMKDAFLSSSGDYEHSYMLDGVIYCHIIDPATGWPINTPVDGDGQRGLATVTVLSDTAAYSDGLSTALCIMGTEKARAYAETHPQARKSALVTYWAGQGEYEVITTLEEGSYEIKDPAYLLK